MDPLQFSNKGINQIHVEKIAEKSRDIFLPEAAHMIPRDTRSSLVEIHGKNSPKNQLLAGQYLSIETWIEWLKSARRKLITADINEHEDNK